MFLGIIIEYLTFSNYAHKKGFLCGTSAHHTSFKHPTLLSSVSNQYILCMWFKYNHGNQVVYWNRGWVKEDKYEHNPYNSSPFCPFHTPVLLNKEFIHNTSFSSIKFNYFTEKVAPFLAFFIFKLIV